MAKWYRYSFKLQVHEIKPNIPWNKGYAAKFLYNLILNNSMKGKSIK
jgi:hypothetical protein